MLVLLVTAELSVIVQVEELGGVMLAGEQVRLETVGTTGWLIVTVAPVPVIAIEFALASVPETPAKVIGVEVCVVVDAIWNVTVARTPSPITFVLSPTTRQRTSPGDTTLQEVCFPAALAAAPVV
ncbi:MAG TPA: hypothetical protein VLX58_05255 [Bryobacteraceae bacterium]|nr:hypothetical protein [Bryobacteraceae bacterium]